MGRAAAELAQFQDRGFGDDVDPDAPAAMKDSPSVSGDDAAGDVHTVNKSTNFTQLPKYHDDDRDNDSDYHFRNMNNNHSNNKSNVSLPLLPIHLPCQHTSIRCNLVSTGGLRITRLEVCLH